MKGTIVNTQAESNVIGSLILKPQQIEMVGELISPRDFDDENLRPIFMALVDMDHEGATIDIATLRHRLVGDGWTNEQCTELLVKCMEETPSCDNIWFYAASMLSRKGQISEAQKSRDAIARALTEETPGGLVETAPLDVSTDEGKRRERELLGIRAALELHIDKDEARAALVTLLNLNEVRCPQFPKAATRKRHLLAVAYDLLGEDFEYEELT